MERRRTRECRARAQVDGLDPGQRHHLPLNEELGLIEQTGDLESEIFGIAHLELQASHTVGNTMGHTVGHTVGPRVNSLLTLEIREDPYRPSLFGEH